MGRWLLALLGCAALSACENPQGDTWQGYLEGEFVNVAAPAAGQLVKLHARRGQDIAQGSPAFVLEQESERAARREAEERLKAALARVNNLRAGRRAPELEAARAQLAQARAARDLSASQLAKAQKLYEARFVSQANLDEAKAAYARDVARVGEAEAQIRTLELPLGRSAELEAARSEADAARAALAQVEWRLAQKTVDAPASGTVQDTYFEEGEWVGAGKPVLTVLPPGRIKARFYVPEGALARLAPGMPVEFSCDGCGAPVRAGISFISTRAEYTPPVLYSKDSRAKLVFLVEARPSEQDGRRLRAGQPIDVRLAAR